MRMNFRFVEQMNRASKRKPRIASLSELKVAFVTFIKENRPELLECKVDTYLWGNGGH